MTGVGGIRLAHGLDGDRHRLALAMRRLQHVEIQQRGVIGRMARRVTLDSRGVDRERPVEGIGRRARTAALRSNQWTCLRSS